MWETRCRLGRPVKYAGPDGIRERVAVADLGVVPRRRDWRPRPVLQARTESWGRPMGRVLALTRMGISTGIEALEFLRRGRGALWLGTQG